MGGGRRMLLSEISRWRRTGISDVVLLRRNRKGKAVRLMASRLLMALQIDYHCFTDLIIQSAIFNIIVSSILYFRIFKKCTSSYTI